MEKEHYTPDQLKEILNSLQEFSEENNEVVIDFDKIKEAWDQVQKTKLFGKQ